MEQEQAEQEQGEREQGEREQAEREQAEQVQEGPERAALARAEPELADLEPARLVEEDQLRRLAQPAALPTYARRTKIKRSEDSNWWKGLR